MITVPEGWNVEAMAARIIAAGFCGYPDLVNGTLNLYDFFSMLRMVDWVDYSRNIVSQTPQE